MDASDRDVAPAGAAVRLLHASDLHIDDGEHGTRGLERVVAAASVHDVDAVLLVGDTFDHNRVKPATLERSRILLSHLSVAVVILPGNHDPLMEGSVYPRLDLPDHVHVLADDAGQTLELADLGVEVWGRAHTSFADSRPLSGLPPRGRQRWQVALAHGHLVRYPDDRHRSYLITSEEIAGCDRDYVALGHWDVQHDVSAGAVTAWYSGSPTRFATCALVTLTDEPAGRQVQVRSVALG